MTARITIKREKATQLGQATTEIDVPAPLNEDAPFRSVEHAMRFAYNMEGRDVLKVSTFFKQFKSSEVFDSEHKPNYVPDFREALKGLEPYELQAQAALIMTLVQRSLNGKLTTFAEAYYTVDDTMSDPEGKKIHGPLYNRKTQRCRYLAGKYLVDVLPHDKDFMGDVVRYYCGLQPERPWEYWMRRLNISNSTLWRWIKTNEKKYTQSVYSVLKGYETSMRTQLSDVLREASLVG